MGQYRYTVLPLPGLSECRLLCHLSCLTSTGRSSKTLSSGFFSQKKGPNVGCGWEELECRLAELIIKARTRWKKQFSLRWAKRNGCSEAELQCFSAWLSRWKCRIRAIPACRGSDGVLQSA